MTLKNSSSGKQTFHLPQIEISKRRRWAVGLTWLLLMLGYVMGFLILMAAHRADWAEGIRWGWIENMTLPEYMAQTAEAWFAGFWTYAVTGLCALILGLQGFSWLHNRRALDFYESQPISRRHHFFDVLQNSCRTFFAAYLAAVLIAVIIAAAFQGLNAEVMRQIGISLLANAGFFAACLGFSTLAAVITGNPVISVLAAGVLFLYEPVLRVLLAVLSNRFFITRYTPNYFSLFSFLEAEEAISPFYHLAHTFGHGLVWHNLLVAAGSLALAYFAYSRRKSESAGTAVVFRPVRAVIKVAVAVLCGLFAGIVLSDSAGTAGWLSMAAIAVIIAVIAACVLEIIYNFNFLSLFRHWTEILLAAGITVLILALFAADPFGYDRWVPQPDEVESAVICPGGGYSSWYFREDGTRYGTDMEYFEDHMFITDTGAVTELAAACRDAMLDDKSSPFSTLQSSGSFSVMYRMKDGRKICRTYQIPEDIDHELVNRIWTSREFREGYYPVYNTEMLDSLNGTFMISWMPADWDGYGTEEQVSRAVSPEAFAEAYRKDLEKTDYYYENEHDWLGTAEAEIKTDQTEGDIYCGGLPVYEGFDSTMAFLRENGLT